MGSRSKRYWYFAFSTFQRVADIGFFSSSVATGRPFTANTTSGMAPLLVLTCRTIVRRLSS
ncbi:hypothetical protein D3C75_923700 [compost metagenome]